MAGRGSDAAPGTLSEMLSAPMYTGPVSPTVGPLPNNDFISPPVTSGGPVTAPARSAQSSRGLDLPSPSLPPPSGDPYATALPLAPPDQRPARGGISVFSRSPDEFEAPGTRPRRTRRKKRRGSSKIRGSSRTTRRRGSTQSRNSTSSGVGGPSRATIRSPSAGPSGPTGAMHAHNATASTANSDVSGRSLSGKKSAQKQARSPTSRSSSGKSRRRGSSKARRVASPPTAPTAATSVLNKRLKQITRQQARMGVRCAELELVVESEMTRSAALQRENERLQRELRQARESCAASQQQNAELRARLATLQSRMSLHQRTARESRAAVLQSKEASWQHTAVLNKVWQSYWRAVETPVSQGGGGIRRQWSRTEAALREWQDAVQEMDEHPPPPVELVGQADASSWQAEAKEESLSVGRGRGDYQHVAVQGNTGDDQLTQWCDQLLPDVYGLCQWMNQHARLSKVNQPLLSDSTAQDNAEGHPEANTESHTVTQKADKDLGEPSMHTTLQHVGEPSTVTTLTSSQPETAVVRASASKGPGGVIDPLADHPVLDAADTHGRGEGTLGSILSQVVPTYADSFSESVRSAQQHSKAESNVPSPLRWDPPLGTSVTALIPTDKHTGVMLVGPGGTAEHKSADSRPQTPTCPSDAAETEANSPALPTELGDPISPRSVTAPKWTAAGLLSHLNALYPLIRSLLLQMQRVTARQTQLCRQAGQWREGLRQVLKVSGNAWTEQLRALARATVGQDAGPDGTGQDKDRSRRDLAVRHLQQQLALGRDRMARARQELARRDRMIRSLVQALRRHGADSAVSPEEGDVTGPAVSAGVDGTWDSPSAGDIDADLESASYSEGDMSPRTTLSGPSADSAGLSILAPTGQAGSGRAQVAEVLATFRREERAAAARVSTPLVLSPQPDLAVTTSASQDSGALDAGQNQHVDAFFLSVGGRPLPPAPHAQAATESAPQVGYKPLRKFWQRMDRRHSRMVAASGPASSGGNTAQPSVLLSGLRQYVTQGINQHDHVLSAAFVLSQEAEACLPSAGEASTDTHTPAFAEGPSAGAAQTKPPAVHDAVNVACAEQCLRLLALTESSAYGSLAQEEETPVSARDWWALRRRLRILQLRAACYEQLYSQAQRDLRGIQLQRQASAPPDKSPAEKATGGYAPAVEGVERALLIAVRQLQEQLERKAQHPQSAIKRRMSAFATAGDPHATAKLGKASGEGWGTSRFSAGRAKGGTGADDWWRNRQRVASPLSSEGLEEASDSSDDASDSGGGGGRESGSSQGSAGLSRGEGPRAGSGWVKSGSIATTTNTNTSTTTSSSSSSSSWSGLVNVLCALLHDAVGALVLCRQDLSVVARRVQTVERTLVKPLQQARQVLGVVKQCADLVNEEKLEQDPSQEPRDMTPKSAPDVQASSAGCSMSEYAGVVTQLWEKLVVWRTVMSQTVGLDSGCGEGKSLVANGSTPSSPLAVVRTPSQAQRSDEVGGGAAADKPYSQWSRRDLATAVYGYAQNNTGGCTAERVDRQTVNALCELGRVSGDIVAAVRLWAPLLALPVTGQLPRPPQPAGSGPDGPARLGHLLARDRTLWHLAKCVGEMPMSPSDAIASVSTSGVTGNRAGRSHQTLHAHSADRRLSAAVKSVSGSDPQGASAPHLYPVPGHLASSSVSQIGTALLCLGRLCRQLAVWRGSLTKSVRALRKAGIERRMSRSVAPAPLAAPSHQSDGEMAGAGDSSGVGVAGNTAGQHAQAGANIGGDVGGEKVRPDTATVPDSQGQGGDEGVESVGVAPPTQTPGAAANAAPAPSQPQTSAKSAASHTERVNSDRKPVLQGPAGAVSGPQDAMSGGPAAEMALLYPPELAFPAARGGAAGVRTRPSGYGGEGAGQAVTVTGSGLPTAPATAHVTGGTQQQLAPVTRGIMDYGPSLDGVLRLPTDPKTGGAHANTPLPGNVTPPASDTPLQPSSGAGCSRASAGTPSPYQLANYGVQSVPPQPVRNVVSHTPDERHRTGLTDRAPASASLPLQSLSPPEPGQPVLQGSPRTTRSLQLVRGKLHGYRSALAQLDATEQETRTGVERRLAELTRLREAEAGVAGGQGSRETGPHGDKVRALELRVRRDQAMLAELRRRRQKFSDLILQLEHASGMMGPREA